MVESQPNRESKREGPIKVDLCSQEVMSKLEEAPVYRKKGVISAREVARDGEEIITVLGGGTKETVNTAKKGDMIVTNPGGEQYVVSRDAFNKRYVPIEGLEGWYKPIGCVRALVNPWGKGIIILAPWGEEQFGDKDCWVALPCDLEGKPTGKPYLIAADAFKTTYELIEQGQSVKK